jgi:cell division protein FtsI/penicillin-binding protein 2
MVLAVGSSEAAIVLDRRSRRVLAMRNEAVAMRAALPPGSTMKPLALTALMKSGKLRAKEAWPCPGTLSIGGRQLNCAHPRMASPMTIETALAYSCNCFVAHVAERLSPGDLPYGRRATGTDALRLQALGEEGVSFTVAELAEAYRQLAATAPPEIVAGMEGAVEYGTAQRAAVAGLKVAGKTGSVRTASGMRVAWFVGWTPDVVIAVRTQGMSGGADAAPVAAEMLKALR